MYWNGNKTREKDRNTYIKKGTTHIRYSTTNEHGYVADITIERKTVRVIGSKTEKEMRPMQGARRDCEETTRRNATNKVKTDHQKGYNKTKK